MKKRLRRFVTILLVLTLAVSFSLPVQAATSFTVSFSSKGGDFGFVQNQVLRTDGKMSGDYVVCWVYYTRTIAVHSSYSTVIYSEGVPSVRFSVKSLFSDFTAKGLGYVGLVPAGAFISLNDVIPLSDNRPSYVPSGVYYLCVVSSFSFVSVSPSSKLGPGNFQLTYTLPVSFDFQRSPGQDVSSLDISDQTAALEQATEKQTDTLTNGYDNTGMNADNDRLSASLDGYEDAESQVTDQSVDFIDAVTFTDPTTHLQLMTAVTWTSTFLQNLFVALGDWSVLVTIALSLAFALMLIGWFKYRK